ncbi:hypothetical protein EJB05_31499, partial [Eragrostis curvula]
MVRHRCLIKIITCCSSIDRQGQDFKALVFEFMPNGSLSDWLYPKSSMPTLGDTLNLEQRLDIAVDIVDALDYLHNQCQPPIFFYKVGTLMYTMFCSPGILGAAPVRAGAPLRAAGSAPVQRTSPLRPGTRRLNAPVSPPARDVHVVHVGPNTQHVPSSPELSGDLAAHPTPLSPVPAPAPPVAPRRAYSNIEPSDFDPEDPPSDFYEGGDVLGDDEEEVYSDGSGGPDPDDNISLAVPEQPPSNDHWLLLPRWELGARYAYAYVMPPSVAVNPAPFIIYALNSELRGVDVELLPSSRGIKLVRFCTMDDREAAMLLMPFRHGYGRLTLERSVDTENRFHRAQCWLAYLAILDFSLEHWFPANIEAAVCKFGTLMEIDPTCISGFDFSSVRVVVELEHEGPVPSDLWLRSPGGAGILARVNTMRVWPRAAQFDGEGLYVPFFPPPHRLPRSTALRQPSPCLT